MTDHYLRTSVSRKLAAGEILFHEGEESDFVYFVEWGELEVFTETAGQRLVIASIGADEFVGELGVLQDTVRHASVKALQDTSVKQHSKYAFIELVAKNPEKSIRLLHSLSIRTRNAVLLCDQIADQIATHNNALSLNPLNSVISFMGRGFEYIKRRIHSRQINHYRRSMPDKVESGLYSLQKRMPLFCEGQESDYACRLVTGRLKVVKSFLNVHENIGYINPGEFVGEIGLLEGTQRSLTVLADADSQVEIYDEDEFLAAITNDVDAGFQMINNLSRRATQLNQHLKEMNVRHADILNNSTLTQAKHLLLNISDVSLSTGKMLEKDLFALQTALKKEASAVQGMVEIYYRYINGKASKEEMELANSEFRNFLKTLGLGALLIIPGSVITIPVIVKMAKSLGIDILPKSRANSRDL